MDYDKIYDNQEERDRGCAHFGHMPEPIIVYNMLMIRCERCRRYLK